MCCTNIKEGELRDISYVPFQQGLAFEMACSFPFILQKLTYTRLPTFFYMQNLSVALRGPLKIVQLPHFKRWKLRLKFIVGLTFVHSFWYSRALFTHLFWFGLNKLIHLKWLEKCQARNHNAQQRFAFVDSEGGFFH